ncbi:hypothetical protein DENSPDRAFT_886481 [Dentipellis sp. KUC8613]|nr:hypothetical protein DENSPDRAFT_886481 [Dentipellis sp. KUC8613]
MQRTGNSIGIERSQFVPFGWEASAAGNSRRPHCRRGLLYSGSPKPESHSLTHIPRPRVPPYRPSVAVLRRRTAVLRLHAAAPRQRAPDALSHTGAALSRPPASRAPVPPLYRRSTPAHFRFAPACPYRPCSCPRAPRVMSRAPHAPSPLSRTHTRPHTSMPPSFAPSIHAREVERSHTHPLHPLALPSAPNPQPHIIAPVPQFRTLVAPVRASAAGSLFAMSRHRTRTPYLTRLTPALVVPSSLCCLRGVVPAHPRAALLRWDTLVVSSRRHVGLAVFASSCPCTRAPSSCVVALERRHAAHTLFALLCLRTPAPSSPSRHRDIASSRPSRAMTPSLRSRARTPSSRRRVVAPVSPPSCRHARAPS